MTTFSPGRYQRLWRLAAPPVGFTVFLGAAAAAAANGHRLPGICIFRYATGFPCPGCGVTRALLELIGGHFRSAWSTAPAAFAVLVFFAMTAVVGVLEAFQVVNERTADQFRVQADKLFIGSVSVGWMMTIVQNLQQ